MKYLITGGCGFIGVNFAENLLKRGDSVILLDNLSRNGTVANLVYLQAKYPQMKFIHQDLRLNSDISLKTLMKLMNEVDVVFHLAGQVAVTTSVLNPMDDFITNALGTLNVLEAIRKSDRKPGIIYASTNKVYGGMTDVKIINEGDHYKYQDYPLGISEERILDFHSPYGCSKGTADQYIRDYARIYGLKTVVMRQSCIYGKRQFGIEDQGWVAWFTIAAHFNSKITIYGDGMQVRDVLYVDDLFEAWDMAATNMELVEGEIFNVGGGSAYTLSLLELLGFLEKLFNKTIPLKFDEWRPGDQPVYISDITKIKSVLGWEPKTDPQTGVKHLADWIKNNSLILKETLNL